MHKVPGSLVCDKNCSFSYSTLKLLVLLYENVHFRILKKKTATNIS